MGLLGLGEITSCFPFLFRSDWATEISVGSLSLREMFRTFFASFTGVTSGPKNFCGLNQSLREVFSRCASCVCQMVPKILVGLLSLREMLRTFFAFFYTGQIGPQKFLRAILYLK